MLTNYIDDKLKIVEAESKVYRPRVFRLNNSEDKIAFESLLERVPGLRVYDTMEAQMKELVKAFHPSVTLSKEEIKLKTLEHLGGIEMRAYGVWVYYPWNDNVVHLLDEEEFVFLRTNRNNYKITDEEEKVLSTKRVGVIGLSVGQSVSLTMAMERTFGELRIADFDDLEITNLNRLRSGVHNMGLLKTVLVAREIAEIDPFLKVTLFNDGITDDNLDSFLLDNGKLDVLIDECDGVDVKIKCRIAAKKYNIPVLMEASDRATIDIERFDLEPERPILHGLVEHLDISNVKNLKTNEEKLPYILPIVGIDTMSPRLKASAVEVGQSISTWPQLASAVTMGGGITADVCRKVLLGQLHVSGRFFIDLDELITDARPEHAQVVYDAQPLQLEEMAEMAAQLKSKDDSNIVKDEELLAKLIEVAIQAPSAGNNQPWKWYNKEGRLLLFDDPIRSAAFANFNGMVTMMSMGTVLENMSLKASELKLELEIELFPLANLRENRLVASVIVRSAPDVQKDSLVAYINSRHTNRKPGDGSKIAAEVIDDIRKSIELSGVASIKILEDSESINAVADIAGKSEKLRMFIPDGHSDLFDREIRWDAESAEQTRDGLDIRTLDLKPKDIVGFQVIKDPRAIALVSDWGKGAALENMTRDLVATSSAVCLISGHSFDKDNFISVGRAAERAWLTATKHGLSMQPFLASVFHFARIKHGNAVGMPENVTAEFEILREKFINLFALTSSSEEPLFLFRLFRAEEPAVKSIRLNVEDVYYSKQ